MSVLAVSHSADPAPETLCAALAGLPEGAPVVILIHGFRYCPGVAGHDPHQLILSPDPAARGGRMVSWPRHLRLLDDQSLAISFGWNARGAIWGAYRRAGAAGVQLARLISRVRRVAPERPVHIVAHSLGARVALTALPRCPPGAVRRMILIAGAAFRAEAGAALACDAARTLEALHVRGPENGMFEALLRAAFPWAGPSLGAGLPGVRGWHDLALDDPATMATLARLGHPIMPARTRICHWSGYTRPGVFGLYRAVLAGRIPMAALTPDGPRPGQPERRAKRLWQALQGRLMTF